MFDFLVIYSYKSENSLIRYGLYYRNKDLIEVQALFLLKPINNPIGLISEDLSIYPILGFKDPFTRKYLTV